MEDRKNQRPYLVTKKIVVQRFFSYNPEYGDDRTCRCGHPYYRHFDTYEDMATIGCKYCQCGHFKESKDTTNVD
jgi:hypothetical protein